MSRWRQALKISVIPLAVVSAARVAAQTPLELQPIGRPEAREGLQVAAGYLPNAIALDPPGSGVPSRPAIHLQVDIDALDGNPYGLESGDSVPYLRIAFTLVVPGTGWRREGTLEPMVSRQGFHYGASVAVPGEGEYLLTIEVRPPQGLVRHTDPYTGVNPWWKPFQLTWRFHCAPGE